MTTGSTVVVLNINPDAAIRTGTLALVNWLRRRINPADRVCERHYRRISTRDLALLQPRAVVVGPQGTPFQGYDQTALEHLFSLLRRIDVPLLGVCGGHQALVLAHGGEIDPIFGDAPPNWDGPGASYKGLRKDRGFREITHVKESLECDPLMTHVPNPGRYFVSHVEEVSQLPSAFDVLAAGDPCRIQIVRRRGHLQYGVQFHPERGGDGPQVLKRFLELAGVQLRKSLKKDGL